MGRGPSKRGVGLGFGPDVTKRWCELNKVTAVIRSHEVRQDGYAIEHDGLCITTFSCPNYCDSTGNKVGSGDELADIRRRSSRCRRTASSRTTSSMRCRTRTSGRWPTALALAVWVSDLVFSVFSCIFGWPVVGCIYFPTDASYALHSAQTLSRKHTTPLSSVLCSLLTAVLCLCLCMTPRRAPPLGASVGVHAATMPPARASHVHQPGCPRLVPDPRAGHC